MSEYKFFKILFFLCVFTFLVIHNINNIIPLFNPYINNNFDDILPRINLNVNSIPSKEEIFKNRELFISNKALTTDYISSNKTFSSFFKKKINIIFFLNIILLFYIDKQILKTKICICTLGKSENRYIREFALYYKGLGVDKIYLI